MPFIIPTTTARPELGLPINTTSNSGKAKKKKKKGVATAAQNYADPYNLIAAKTTAGHKAVWDGALGHYKYS